MGCGRNDIIRKDIATHEAREGVLDIPHSGFGHEINIFGGSSRSGCVTL
jgi:hypothetical protein